MAKNSNIESKVSTSPSNATARKLACLAGALAVSAPFAGLTYLATTGISEDLQGRASTLQEYVGTIGSAAVRYGIPTVVAVSHGLVTLIVGAGTYIGLRLGGMLKRDEIGIAYVNIPINTAKKILKSSPQPSSS